MERAHDNDLRSKLSEAVRACRRRLYAWRLVTLKGRTVGRAVGLGLPPTGVSAEVALVGWRARHARRMALRCAALGWAVVDLREARRSHLAAAQIARGDVALASRKRRDEERQERAQQDALQPPIEQAAAAAQAAGCSGAAPSE